MSVRKKSTMRKFASKIKRGSKRTVIAVTSIPLLPVRIVGGSVKSVGESLTGKGDRRITVGEPLSDKKMIWRGRAYKMVGGTINFVGDTVSYPVLIFDDHTNNIKARMDLEARMDGVGWQSAVAVGGSEEYLPQGATGQAMTFIPKNDQAVSETKALRELEKDYVS